MIFAAWTVMPSRVAKLPSGAQRPRDVSQKNRAQDNKQPTILRLIRADSTQGPCIALPAAAGHPPFADRSVKPASRAATWHSRDR